MNATIDTIGPPSPPYLFEPQTDLHSIKSQIRIARLKLGAILESLDRLESSPVDLDDIVEGTADISAAIDRLVGELPAGDEEDRFAVRYL